MSWRPRFRSNEEKRGPITSAYTVPTEGPGSQHHEAIQNAIDNGYELEVVYQGNNDAKGLQRKMHPKKMVEGRQPGTTALIAHDPDAGIEKEFRTDRIIKILGYGPIPEAQSTTPSKPVSAPPAQATEPVDDGNPPIYLINGRNKCPNCGASTSIATNGVPTPPTCRGKSSCGVVDTPTYAPSGNSVPQLSPQWGIVKQPTLRKGINQKTGDIEPSDEEYGELQSLDIDPETFDRATVRRLRNHGATHEQLKEVSQGHGLPLEDYEQALQNNDGDHSKAIQDALGYQARDREQITQNQKRNADNPSYAAARLLSPEQHGKDVQKLFVHHINLKNSPAERFDERFRDIPGRRRANEWILSELSKVMPSLKGKLNNKTYFDPNTIEVLKGSTARNPNENGTDNYGYDDTVDGLLKHHGALLATATDLPQLTKQRRIMKALNNVGNSRYFPNDYNADVYEEE